MKTKSILTLGLLLLLLLGSFSAAADVLTLPADTLVIEQAAFLNCTSLTGALVIPAGVTQIGPSAFAGCSGFTGVPVIPDSVQFIGARAFAGCSGLSGTLYLADDIEVDETAFAECPNLTVIRGIAPAMRVALILDGPADAGDINGDCYAAASSYCAGHGYELTVVEAGDGAVDEAVAAGCNVVLMPGFQYADALSDGAEQYPDVRFIGIDFEPEGELPSNAFTATYREEQAGFMAGYAAVRLGYRHLGFLGGMAIPSVNRYGFGFVQGADAAAAELSITDQVCVEFDYAGTFGPNEQITEHMRKWYDAMGVEVVFACGGGIWGAVGGATAECGKGKLIGVDTDQAASMDEIFGQGITVTSAVKSVGTTVRMALSAIDSGDWASLGGTTANLGVVSADPSLNHVGLAASTQFGTGFSRSNYEALVAGLYNGSYAVSADNTNLPETGIAVRTEDPVCVAVIADAGGVEDRGFNQSAYEGALSVCAENGMPLQAYTLDGNDGNGLDAVNEAVFAGFDTLILPGFGFAETIADAQETWPGVRFIGLDLSAADMERSVAQNTFLASYREEQAGFMAGYAAVSLGYRHLGFIGGMEIPSVMRYGYGFVQGANAAAAVLDAADEVTVEFSYANAFQPSDELTNRMRIWYTQGVEVVFSCGGGIWGSVAEAASQVAGAMVIGVDVDQAPDIGEARTLTSAMKGLDATVSSALQAIVDGNWNSLGGTEQRLGVVGGGPEESYVRLAPSTRFGTGFTRQDYESLMQAIFEGECAISDSIDAMPETGITVNKFDAAENGIAVVTGSVTQSEEERSAAVALQKLYSIEAVQLATYPENFYENMDETAGIISDFGEDPVVKAIVVCQAVPGTAEGFRRVKQSRNDVLCLAGEPQDSLDEITAYADVAVTTDQVARGYLIVRTAEQLGCDTFVHLSFPRHLNIDGIALRLAVMKEAGSDLGVRVVEEEVMDPVGPEGYAAAVTYMSTRMPELIQTYGPNTAFFCTNDGLIEELIRQLVAHGGYFIEADLPSPLLGYPQALGIAGLDAAGYEAALSVVEDALVLAGCSDRFGTWAYPYTRTLVSALAARALDVLSNGGSVAAPDALCSAMSACTPGAEWNGIGVGNLIKIFQDTYIMGDPGHYAGNASVVIPAHYYDIEG